MEDIVWHRDFSIKNVDLDKQHELIFEICKAANKLVDKVEKDPQDPAHKEELKDLVVKLFQYIKQHLKDEEEFMQSISFPLLEEHRKAHKILITKAKNILEHVNDTKKFAQELSILTKKWILEHFATDDMWIANYVHKAVYLKEIHHTLEMYIKLKSIERDISKDETYPYICMCPLRIHQVPKTIHGELLSESAVLKCEDCEQILVYLRNNEFKENISDLQKEYLALKDNNGI